MGKILVTPQHFDLRSHQAWQYAESGTVPFRHKEEMIYELQNRANFDLLISLFQNITTD